jgi:hypothetical protein
VIDTGTLQELTQDKMKEMRELAIQTLINNQECFVAQWIIQNPFENIQDYQLKFYNDDPHCVYSARMEKIV